MEMTLEEHNQRKARSYKLILWFAMLSMTMMFAGLTSAFVISKSRGDWLKDFQVPSAFIISTVLIVLCSGTMHWAKISIKKNDKKTTTKFLYATFVLALLFIYFQFKGFGQVVEQGY